MTDVNEKAEKFYNVVVEHLDRKTFWHYPDPECYINRCRWSSKRCDWTEIRCLVTAFWETAPDVNRKWKRAVKRTNMDPHSFHELLVGIFIGGARAPTLLDSLDEQERKAQATLTDNIENPKAP